jgi:beta-1,4-mannosyl-glycoprotein beta-1,4-N-acetylglucosaminyltransferase
MKIFDCFMYFDEDIVLDVRLNYLSKYVDKFIIIESRYNHRGEKRDPQFNIEKFEKFEKKINYILIDKEPDGIEKVNENDNHEEKSRKFILNAIKRENFQRNIISRGIEDADDNDWILISDLDEIPNLKNNDLKKFESPLVFFKQHMMYYKFNLILENYSWLGTKACKKKNLKTPQWLRNIKDRPYPWWRIDTYFSNIKYIDIKIIEQGGWHFSYIKSPEDIEKKLKSYLHHREYDVSPVGVENIRKMIDNKKTIYNLKADMRSNKFDGNNELTKIDLDLLPNYISENVDKFSKWIEK